MVILGIGRIWVTQRPQLSSQSRHQIYTSKNTKGAGMSKRQARAALWVASATGLAVMTLCLSGCDDDPTRQATSPAPAASQSPVVAPVAANLRQVCDHAPDAFRDGGLDDAEQNRALSAELQGMMDVAEPDAAQVLRPMAEAAGAIAADGRERARPALQRAENRAYSTLQRLCVRAGSQAWNG